ncbi:MAG: hypothetical protein AABX96_04130, partial [Nanoarchaeota archaeon]
MVVKCQGRFASLRERLYAEALPIVLGDREMASVDDLQDMWDLVGDELIAYDNHSDSYFRTNRDKFRRIVPHEGLALLPLLDSSVKPDLNATAQYGMAMGCNPSLAARLFFTGIRTDDSIARLFDRDARDIRLPDGKNLGEYQIKGNVGIGTLSHGGDKGGGIRSDSPFLLEVYHKPQKGQDAGKRNLVGVVGFWPQNDNMLISQMQSSKNAKYPDGAKFGVASLLVAEAFGRLIGFKGIQVYSARNSPHFLAHPDDFNDSEFRKGFECMFDSSAHKLGYVGCSTNNY